MRSLILIGLLSMGAWAVPLTVKPEAKARSFTIEAEDGWVPAEAPNTLHKHEEKDPEGSFPQSLSASAVYDRDAGSLVANMKRFAPGKFEIVKLGDIEALLSRDKTSFDIYAGLGTTKVVIHYTDGRDSLDRTPYDSLLQRVKSSFRWNK